SFPVKLMNGVHCRQRRAKGKSWSDDVKKQANVSQQFEAEAVYGLEKFAADELCRLRAGAVSHLQMYKGAVRFQFSGDPNVLQGLRTVQAVYSVERFDVPRPRALLGDAHFRRLVAQIAAVRKAQPDQFATFQIAAAGSDSSVMQRIKREIAAAVGIPHADSGDLLIRILPDDEGWRTLVRLTPRPLATRSWRAANYEGALNGAVAYCMALLTQPQPGDSVVNLGSGSGSLLIERCFAGAARQVIGIDRDPAVIELARANVGASGTQHRVHLACADMRALPLPASSTDALLADLPFGQRVGSHADNLALYPAALAEAARIAKPGARFVVITHEIRLMDSALQRAHDWRLVRVLPIILRGLHPRIYVLQRC
ncbi:MAG: RNA methyltransferase, partial [Phototrophicales bacterium]